MSNAEIMTQARESLSGRWPLAIGAFVIFVLILWAGQVAAPLSLVISGPLAVGVAFFSLNIFRKKDASVDQVFEGFKIFANSLVAYLLMLLYTFLWTLLLIIPGIIAALSYSQTMYILAEDRNITGSQAIKKSKELMRGQKWKLFCLNFRFFGWFLLSILTLGVGFLWLIPYIHVSYAGFYESLKVSEAK
jgi:uncharacterized membrane protein